MIQKYRKQFNEEFSQEKYQKLIETLEKSSGTTNGFRQSESPIFLSKDFKNKLTDACDSIISQVKTFSNEELHKAIPKNPDSRQNLLRLQMVSVVNQTPFLLTSLWLYPQILKH